MSSEKLYRDRIKLLEAEKSEMHKTMVFLSERDVKRCEQIAQLQAEKAELMELVKSAFAEGYSLGYGDGNSDGQSYTGRSCRDDGQWKDSDSIELLNKLQ